jgi:hypothetical protein
MRQEDWFDKLHFVWKGTLLGEGEARQWLLTALTDLEKMLDGAEDRRAFSDIRGLYGFNWGVRLRADERQRAERLCARLWNEKGTGRTYAEEALLGQVGVQASPDSLPFFRAALEANRERDSFQAQRRRIAVAAVAFIARQTGDAAAHAQLEAWLEQHPDIAVRTEAVALYGRLHLRRGRLDKAARAVLSRVAYEDGAFAPRFLARLWLHVSGIPMRVEPPDGVYAFKVSLGRVSRTVELTASHSLDHLAHAILSAFEWDHDHLFEFALTGELRERRFVLSQVDEEPLGIVGHFSDVLAPPEDSDTPGPLLLPLGGFGFIQGHKFIFRYDFGDDHRFKVTVAGIQAHQSPGEIYPRVVARTGEAPEQYPPFE